MVYKSSNQRYNPAAEPLPTEIITYLQLGTPLAMSTKSSLVNKNVPISRALTPMYPKNIEILFNVYIDFDLYPDVDLDPDFDLDRELGLQSMSRENLKDIPELLPPTDLSPGGFNAIIPRYERSSPSLLETLTLDQARNSLGVHSNLPSQK